MHDGDHTMPPSATLNTALTTPLATSTRKMAFIRHPRYFLMVCVMGLVTLFLVFHSANGLPEEFPEPRSYPLAFRGKQAPLGYVQDQIRISETRYRASLEERKGMISKWGLTKVDPFPSHGEFYTLCMSVEPSTVSKLTAAQGISLHLPSNVLTGRNVSVRVAFVNSLLPLKPISGTLGDGGKWMCGLELIEPKKNCVIYSFG